MWVQSQCVLDLNNQTLSAQAEVLCLRCNEPIRDVNDPIESVFKTCANVEGHFHVSCVGEGRKRRHFTRDEVLK